MENSGAYLIVGSDGIIGRALADRLSREGKHVWETTRRPDRVSGRRVWLDMAEDVSVRGFPKSLCAVVICAAVTSLERCRTAPEQSAHTNVCQTVALASRLAEQGLFVVFPSTNLVYDGSKPHVEAEEPVCPRTEYGRQKAEAERQLLKLGEQVAIVRLTKVLSPEMRLVNGWVSSLQRGQAIQPFWDMVMAPVSLSFAVEAIGRVAEARLSGITHVSAENDVTYAEVAQYLARRLNVSPRLVTPIRSSDTDGTFEAIPRHTTLDTGRLRSTLGLVPPDVWTTVDTVFDPSA